MNTKVMTMNEIRRTGIQSLIQSLGAIGMVRFLQQGDIGWGDYTKERTQWLGNPGLEEIAADIKAKKKMASILTYLNEFVLKLILANFFAHKAINEADKIWDQQNLSDEIMDEWLNEE